MKFVKIQFILMALFPIVGCDSSINKTEIVGTYITDTGHEYNRLTIDQSGNYKLEYKTIGSDLIESREGVWEFNNEESGSEMRIIINDFKFWERINRKSKQGMWVPVVEKSFGTIYLCFDFDIATSNGCFKKTTDK